MPQNKHKYLEEQIKLETTHLGLTHFRASKWHFPYFKPDVVVSVGPKVNDIVAIDAIATTRALNRVLGGFHRDIKSGRIRHCVAVVHPFIETEIHDLYDRARPHTEEMDEGIITLSLADLASWLRKELVQCAEETIKEFSDKFYHYLKKE